MKVSSKDHQVQKLAEIGSQLKYLREEQNISLGKIKQITLISERHLRAIEEGNIDALPEPIYIQGFIRKYANVLGVADIAEQFPLTNFAPKTTWFKSSELRPLHLYFIYIAIISAAVGTLSNQLSPAIDYSVSDRETQLSDAAKIESKSNKSNLTPDRIESGRSPKSSLKPIAKTNAKNNSEPKNLIGIDLDRLPKIALKPLVPVSVGIVMKGESWMRVEVDGAVKFEGILTEGTNKAWTAEKNIVVRAGNAAAVLLEFNQFPPQTLGEAGEVVQKTFNANYKPKATLPTTLG